MPRARRVKPIMPLAASPAQIAYALGIRAEMIAAAIKSGELICRAVGPRRRIEVRQAMAWYRRTFPPVI